MTDVIMIRMAMLMDLNIASGEVEVWRVGERIEQLIQSVVRSVWRSPDQWELTEGQESHNLAAER